MQGTNRSKKQIVVVMLLYFFGLQLSDVTMKLIGSLTSPYVRKVRVVMAEKKTRIRTRT